MMRAMMKLTIRNVCTALGVGHGGRVKAFGIGQGLCCMSRACLGGMLY
jgi:hypothetical protein